MKNRFLIFPFLLLLSALSFSCTPTDDDNNNDDDSPGVDEYFRMNWGGEQWDVENDEFCMAVFASFGTGPKIIFAATRESDSTNINFSVPYFSGNDTSYATTSSSTLAVFMSTGAYQVESGNIQIQRSTNGSQQVYDGNFDIIYKEIFTDSLVHATNGEFRMARSL